MSTILSDDEQHGNNHEDLLKTGGRGYDERLVTIQRISYDNWNDHLEELYALLRHSWHMILWTGWMIN